ncbi:hypothetical protein F9L33_06680 [Amylibacter sp. SFDW26]|uniref:hypothetical protein n=1 Tax=Amylibacter sp. SFDW26 TaxID=2652722 RepID=UPI00126278CC|nr:hypothetical protein [Amylibacter sp. SFDW26]KAB7614327.1 hypothetical protein F9L33_06680 [Amylibacter sp. SFDW26]
MRKTTTALSALAIAAALTPALAASAPEVTDQIVAQMKEQGYTNITVETSLLGRTEIEGEKDGEEREVVLNKSGEILRDEVELESDDD